jgi:putative RNA 2'-phosphotransferase
LHKALAYALGRRPDEFGLVSEGGAYRVKDILKALAEEGWSTREAQLQELNLEAVASGEPLPLIFEGEWLRLAGGAPPEPVAVSEIPALLYAHCRWRAHATVGEKGLWPGRGPWVVLVEDQEMAYRLGRRLEPEPLVFPVEAERALAGGVNFHRLGERLYLCPELPPRFLRLPPPPKERPEKEAKVKPPPEGPRLPPPESLPGSFLLRLDKDRDKGGSEEKGAARAKRKKDWQSDRRRQRRDKGH